MSDVIYLDFASSTPLLPNVKEKLLSVLDYYGNPSSIHSMGVDAKGLIDIAKDKIAKKFHCDADEIYFTSGATMSNNVAIQGFIKNNFYDSTYFITSMMEHDDIYLMVNDFPYTTSTVYIPCDKKTGRLDLEILEKEIADISQFSHSPILVSIQWANNEMGVIQDMEVITEIVKSYPNAYIHTDATQLVPYQEIDLHDLGVDFLSCSSQKIGGLKGTGLLYVKKDTNIKSVIYGDQGLIGGTENVPGIVCMGEAVDSLNYSNERIENLRVKRDYLYEKIKDLGNLIGTFENRLPNNICMTFDGIRGEAIVALLSSMGVCVSSGSACSSHSNIPSRTLKAMGYSDEEVDSSVRITIGDNTSIEELDRSAKYIRASIEAIKD